MHNVQAIVLIGYSYVSIAWEPEYAKPHFRHISKKTLGDWGY